ncbi:hypothetical protein [Saccharothrix sp.]|uniref:hypothetical protein n=1 Tax=Saccharothrix sp. TaxID=1873460 RepID=UPI0028120F4A|nr:hypothetical protein [Saccharothrix sp.]
MARLLDERQLDDILHENAPRIPVLESTGDEGVQTLARWVLVVVATLVIALALVLSLWPEPAGTSPGAGTAPVTGTAAHST